MAPPSTPDYYRVSRAQRSMDAAQLIISQLAKFRVCCGLGALPTRDRPKLRDSPLVGAGLKPAPTATRSALVAVPDQRRTASRGFGWIIHLQSMRSRCAASGTDGRAPAAPYGSIILSLRGGRYADVHTSDAAGFAMPMASEIWVSAVSSRSGVTPLNPFFLTSSVYTARVVEKFSASSSFCPSTIELIFLILAIEPCGSRIDALIPAIAHFTNERIGSA